MIIITIIITIPPFILTSLIKDVGFLIEAPWVSAAHLSTLPRPVVSYRVGVVAPTVYRGILGLLAYGIFVGLSQMLNVWYIYLHLPPKHPKTTQM